jgi:hypothetical protein
MRAWSCFVVAGALAGCSAKTIDAGTNETGATGVTGEAGSGNAATMVASNIQVPVLQLLSDGSTLFWVDQMGFVSSMPVGGGSIRTLLTGTVDAGFEAPNGALTTLLAVDSVNLYCYQLDTGGVGVGGGGAIFSIPKEGGAPALISEPGAPLTAATTLGANAYWLETVPQSCGAPGQPPCTVSPPVLVKSAPLQGAPISVLAQIAAVDLNGPITNIGVTETTVVLTGPLSGLVDFPTLSGVPDGGMPQILEPGEVCSALFSDVDAVYCYNGGGYQKYGSITRIVSDGGMATLGTTIDELTTVDPMSPFSVYGFAFDDTNVYWVDDTNVGTIMKAPKTGGATAVIARDTNPIAIAVDATSVYWSDFGGEIRRIPK